MGLLITSCRSMMEKVPDGFGKLLAIMTEDKLRAIKDQDKLKAVHAALVEGGAEEGIVFNFEAIALTPNTNAAHRLIRWALTAGVQDQVVEALFKQMGERGNTWMEYKIQEKQKLGTKNTRDQHT